MTKLVSKANLSKIIVATLLIMCISGNNSCSNIERTEPVYVLETEPVKFDFEEIQKRGTLRMITRYSSRSYFLLRGRDRGFEYELVSRFARENGLKVEVVLIGTHEDPLHFLETGEGDLIADHLAINKALQDQVTFSKPYNFIEQVYDISETKIENAAISQHPYDEMSGFATNHYRAVACIFDEKSTGMTTEKNEKIAWAIRKNTPVLKQKVDEFIGKHIQVRESDGHILRSAYLNNEITF